jgi:hypothetical protein
MVSRGLHLTIGTLLRRLSILVHRFGWWVPPSITLDPVTYAMTTGQCVHVLLALVRCSYGVNLDDSHHWTVPSSSAPPHPIRDTYSLTLLPTSQEAIHVNCLTWE